MRTEDIRPETRALLEALGLTPDNGPEPDPDGGRSMVGFVTGPEFGDIFACEGDVPGDFPLKDRACVAISWALADMRRGLHGELEALLAEHGLPRVLAALTRLTGERVVTVDFPIVDLRNDV